MKHLKDQRLHFSLKPHNKRKSPLTFCLGALAGALLAAPGAQAASDGIPVHGFADVIYGESSQNAPTLQSARGFSLGTLDLYLAPEFKNNLKSLFEIAFDVQGDGTIGTDTERMQIGYTISNDLTVWAGRFHTPFGYWNTAFHHGGQIQPSIQRPRFLAFEDSGGVMPDHSNGALASGRTAVGDGHLTYDGYIANSDRITGVDATNAHGGLDFNLKKDDDSSRGFGGNVGYDFAGSLDGLRVGVHLYDGLVSLYPDANVGSAAVAKVNLLFYGGYLVYENHGAEFYSEFYHFSNKNKTAGADQSSTSSTAWYAHAGYQLAKYLVLYAREEVASYDQRDLYFSAQDSGIGYRRTIAGLRIPLTSDSVIKIDGNYTIQADQTNYHEGRLQYAVAF